MRAYKSSFGVGEYGLKDFVIDRVSDLRSRVCGYPEVPTLLHITHAKAGSTWIAHLLSRLFGTRCAPRGVSLTDYVFKEGRVYSGMFLTRDEVEAHPQLARVSRFVIIRDLRDTLVSLYFSLKVSHSVASEFVSKERVTLQDLSEEEGLLHLIQNRMQRVAAIQRSWFGQDDLVVRYEDLVADPYATLELALIDRLKLAVPRHALRRAIRRTHFQNVFKRKMGVEDVKSHGRNGLPGDWRNRFTPSIRRQFAERFGKTLIDTGYEQDDQWVCD